MKNVIITIISLFLIASSSQAAGMLVADGGFGGKLDIESQDVRVTINNGIAVTEVTQVFVNKENRIVEALYTFPVPKSASVANFSMWINGKEMIGEVLEKKRAKQIYESYKKTRVDPGLLEQKDYRTFEMRIFPIPAKGKQKVLVTYYQELDTDNNWANFVYPLASTTDGATNTRTTGRFSLDMKVKSEIPITKMESSSHSNDFAFVKHNEHYWQASLEVKEGDLNRDLVLAYNLERPKTGFDIICSNTGDEDGHFCMTLAVGKELDEVQKGMNYVFLLDISGSMQNDRKLGTSTESIEAFVKELSPEDRFNMISFNVGTQQLFNKSLPANQENLKEALAFLDKQRAKGGTDLRPAMRKAYDFQDPDRPLNVVVLSDGVTEQGSSSELMSIIQSRPKNTRVFCIGVGNDINRPLLKSIAKRSGGLAAFLSRGDNFTRQAKAFRRKLLRPAISNIKIDFSADVYDVEPKIIPNLYHGMPIRIYGRYKGDGDFDINLSGDLMGKAFKDKATINFPAKDLDNPEIERMWAWHKSQRLINQIKEGSKDQKLTDEVVRLCETYSIVSEYASFLVLENDAEYKRWKIDRKNALRIKRDRRSRQRTLDELSNLRQKVDQNIGPEAIKKAQEEKKTTTSRKPSNVSQNNTRTSSPQRRSRSWNVGGGGAFGATEFFGILLLAMGALFITKK